MISPDILQVWFMWWW